MFKSFEKMKAERSLIMYIIEIYNTEEKNQDYASLPQANRNQIDNWRNSAIERLSRKYESSKHLFEINSTACIEYWSIISHFSAGINQNL